MILEFEINGARVIVSGDNIVVSISDGREPKPRPMKPAGRLMDAHPLVDFSNRTGKTLTAIARKAGCSRMTLYRVMNGENTTVGLLRRISNATNGEVPMSAFLPSSAVSAA